MGDKESTVRSRQLALALRRAVQATGTSNTDLARWARPGWSTMTNRELARHDWRTSSFTNDEECVELSWPSERPAVRDSKNPTGPCSILDESSSASSSARSSAELPLSR